MQDIMETVKPETRDWLKSVARIREESVEEYAAAILNEHAEQIMKIMSSDANRY